MQSDFGDIRFTLSDVYINSILFAKLYLGVSANFILNIPSIPEGTGNSVEIKVYAGNSNVTTTSNPMEFMMDYDDFDNTLSTKWTFLGGNWSECR